MFSILCCFRKKPASPSQVVETGKKISPLLPPPQVTKTAKKQPTPPGLNKRITVKDGGLIVSKSTIPNNNGQLRCQVDASWVADGNTSGFGYVIDTPSRSLIGIRGKTRALSPFKLNWKPLLGLWTRRYIEF
ncbi:unnamed protein product [Arabidopsis thaliana]|uniref:(thale cress) hypothetical protein n=1 Tax=Arabidopsis thaliana TaxID=3702 RepID=A0A7G2E200_ARATH|nr:unnamed protein product [Arabidopsis thaliana]